MKVINYKPNRVPDRVIKTGDHVYMNRWFIQRCKETMSIYYHEILKSDWQEEYHDHPWPSVSFILKGCLLDKSPENPDGVMLSQGMVVQREANDAHKLILNWGPVETLFVTGPVIRDWGFHCKEGFKKFEDYARDGGCD